MKVPIDDCAVIDLDAPVLPAYEAFVDGSTYWLVWCKHCRKWRRHVVHTGTFLSYASEERSGPGDAVRPENVTRVSVGGYRALWGDGTHRLGLRNVAFLRCPVAGARLGLLSVAAPLAEGLNIEENGSALPLWVESQPVRATDMDASPIAPAGASRK